MSTKSKTRKLSYRKHERVIRPIHG